MSTDELVDLRARLHLEDAVPDPSTWGDDPPFCRPAEGSAELTYLLERRRELAGPVPERRVQTRAPFPPPGDDAFAELRAGSRGQLVSTTGAFTRLLRNLARDPGIGGRIVPIIPDEARTFGMDALFRELKIYAAKGQLYEPVDHSLLLSYAEGRDGQILEEGITEAGAMSSFLAAGTSYATHGTPMVPFFTFYSMFGFQRVGDLIWQASDARTRGFLCGATAGRTTLLGEGLQHQDGHSLVLASTVPTVRAYDPAFAYEVAAIVRAGLAEMYPDPADASTGADVIYYLTLYNEPWEMPAQPEGLRDDEIVRGLYRLAPAPEGPSTRATLLFSGSAVGAARAAQAELAERWGVGVELWSATSYKSLREEALSAERWNRLHPTEIARTPLVTELLAAGEGPIVAVSDFMKAVPDQIARWAQRPFVPLGTDGFGRSDTRQALRRFFEVDAGHVGVAVLAALAQLGSVDAATVQKAIAEHDIDPDLPDPRIS
jgi:pyruvate dehydrogenase E1 component